MNAFLASFDVIGSIHPFKMTISTDGRCVNIIRQGGFREINDYKGDTRLEKDDALKDNPIIADFERFAKEMSEKYGYKKEGGK